MSDEQSAPSLPWDRGRPARFFSEEVKGAGGTPAVPE
jgi:hypothetical protein